MRKKIWAKLSNCFWVLLAASFLMLHSSFAGNAQNDSALNLAGTEWVKDRVTIPNGVDNSVITVLRYYAFDKQGKLKSTVLTVKSPGFRQEYVFDYNPATRRSEYRYKYVPTPPKSKSNVLDGTYKISGRSIIIDLPDCTIGANIDGDFMRGVVNYKENNRKEEWVVTRAKNQTTSTNNSNQNNSNGGNPTESLNKSLPLSMKERLPERLGQFQRTSFETETHHDYYHPKREGGFDTSGFGTPGVESAFATYGKIEVWVTRFEDAVEAGDYFQERIDLLSPNSIVRRGSMKNQAGQSVEELVVTPFEVMFRYSVYYYLISSPDPGKSLEIQELLPLE